FAASEGTVEQAVQAYRIAEVRYREGISPQTELSDSRISLQQAQANRAQAARDLQVARVRFALLHDLPISASVAPNAGTMTAPQQPAQSLTVPPVMTVMPAQPAPAAIVVACRGNGGAPASAPAAVEVGRENIAVAAVEQLQSGPAISGTLEARQTATLRAEVAGPVLQTYVDRGQPVRRGALLARIDDTALRQAALSAQSAARSAKLSLDNAQRNLDRSAALEKAGAIAERDLESAQSAVAAAAAANEDAQARLTQARQTLDKTFVRAPFDGQVSDRQVSAGDVVQPGT